MEWFENAKLGIFIHWGIYAVKGVAESWEFYSGRMEYDDYMEQLDGFTAKNYNPEKCAELFKKIGVKYVVLTSKHHDGVALWDTKANDLSVVQKTPAKRDLIAPYCEAMRKNGLKVGLYYSHLDWSHPDYPSIHAPWPSNRFTDPPEGVPDDFARWESFLKFHRTQLHELLTGYGTLDLLWFDGTWERTAEQWKFKEMRDFIRKTSPNTLVNARIGEYGDYECPENSLPTVQPEGRWELCQTLTDSWGYRACDTNYKSVREIVRIFTECIGMGGNLLLGIGPKEDGTLDEKVESTLTELGEWVNTHGEAIYGTERGLPAGLFHGNSTLSKDKKTLYLFYHDIPVDQICIKGICSEAKRVTVLDSGASLPFRVNGGLNEKPGLLWINFTKEHVNKVCTVLKVEFDEPIRLYLGKSGGI